MYTVHGKTVYITQQSANDPAAAGYGSRNSHLYK